MFLRYLLILCTVFSMGGVASGAGPAKYIEIHRSDLRKAIKESILNRELKAKDQVNENITIPDVSNVSHTIKVFVPQYKNTDKPIKVIDYINALPKQIKLEWLKTLNKWYVSKSVGNNDYGPIHSADAIYGSISLTVEG